MSSDLISVCLLCTLELFKLCLAAAYSSSSITAAVLSDKVIKLQLAEILPRHCTFGASLIIASCIRDNPRVGMV